MATILNSEVLTQSNARAYLELTKPRLVLLNLLSTAVGFLMAARELDWPRFIVTLSGAALVAAGAMALNEWIERDEDALMQRTAGRPLPAKKIDPPEALKFGIFLAWTGLTVLAFGANPFAALCAGLTFATYLMVYTPLKKETPLCIFFGAIPGALPPLIGWTAARGSLSPEAWTLFAIVFFWQIPHFLAIGWTGRRDYAIAGFHMLPKSDPRGDKIAIEMILCSLILLPVGLLPYFLGMSGKVYAGLALALGTVLVTLSFRAFGNMEKSARPLFRFSILYLSLIFLTLVIDKV